jgi:chromosomal replication initiator protein
VTDSTSPPRDWLIVSTVTIHGIVRRVAHHHGLTIEHLRGTRRDRIYAAPRHLAMWLAAHLVPDATLAVIGRAFNRDHTTVRYARDKLDSLHIDGRICAPDEIWHDITAERDAA